MRGSFGLRKGDRNGRGKEGREEERRGRHGGKEGEWEAEREAERKEGRKGVMAGRAEVMYFIWFYYLSVCFHLFFSLLMYFITKRSFNLFIASITTFREQK